jgi:hypothetical protein
MMATQHTIKNKSSQVLTITLYNDATGKFYNATLEPGDSVVESDSGVALIPQLNWLLKEDLVSVYPPIEAMTSAEWNKWFSRGIRFNIASPEAKDYVMELSAPCPYTITRLAGILLSGTCKVTVKINGTSVNGLTNVDLSTTIAEATPLASAAVAQGDKIEVTVSNLSSPEDMALTLRVRKELA